VLTRFHDDGAPAWLATIRRADGRGAEAVIDT
jgi:hypothetical protein